MFHPSPCLWKVEELKAAVRAADEECLKAKTEVEGLKLKLRKADEQMEDLNHMVSIRMSLNPIERRESFNRLKEENRSRVPDVACLTFVYILRSVSGV